MSCDQLRIATVNACGLGSDFKRRKMFHYFHQKEFDIVFIQEAHSVKSNFMIKKWKAQWGGRIYFSHGQSNARGTCMLFKKNLRIKIKRSYCDADGRVLILDVNYDNLDLTLASIYAPK